MRRAATEQLAAAVASAQRAPGSASLEKLEQAIEVAPGAGLRRSNKKLCVASTASPLTAVAPSVCRAIHSARLASSLSLLLAL